MLLFDKWVLIMRKLSEREKKSVEEDMSNVNG